MCGRIRPLCAYFVVVATCIVFSAPAKSAYGSCTASLDDLYPAVHWCISGDRAYDTSLMNKWCGGALKHELNRRLTAPKELLREEASDNVDTVITIIDFANLPGFNQDELNALDRTVTASINPRGLPGGDDFAELSDRVPTGTGVFFAYTEDGRCYLDSD